MRFEFCGGVDNDIHRLDADGNGIACETLPQNNCKKLCITQSFWSVFLKAFSGPVLFWEVEDFHDRFKGEGDINLRLNRKKGIIIKLLVK